MKNPLHVVAGGKPVDYLAKVVTSSVAKPVGVLVDIPQLQTPHDDELVPVPEDGMVSLRLAGRCRFVPKAVLFRGKRLWLEPMDWERAFDAALALLDEWHGPTMQYIDEKFMGSQLPRGIDVQWTYCYCLRNICRFLEIDYDEIRFMVYVRKAVK